MKNEVPHRRVPRPVARPGRKRIHHSPLFWAGAVMFLTAMAIYLWSEDLSWWPGG